MMLHIVLAVHTNIPGWLQSPDWFRPMSRALGHFVRDHQALGLFLVIFAEELGIPLPAPGDVAIAWGGYLTTTGEIPYPMAYIAVIVGAVTGSFCLFSLSRRFGHPFVLRFGRYVGLNAARLDRAERQFRRWGPWAIIIGRHIPGMRIVLSAFAGIFDVPARVFVPSVLVSAAVWAALFLELGRALGRNSRFLFRLLPAHLLPLFLLVVGLLFVAYVAYEHGWRPLRESRRHRARMSALETAEKPAPEL